MAWHLSITSQVMCVFFQTQCVFYVMDLAGKLVWSGFLSFYCIAIPLCILPLSLNWVTSNEWRTLVSCSLIFFGSLFQGSFCFWTLFVKCDWQLEIQKATERMKKSEKALLSKVQLEGDESAALIQKQRK